MNSGKKQNMETLMTHSNYELSDQKKNIYERMFIHALKAQGIDSMCVCVWIQLKIELSVFIQLIFNISQLRNVYPL